MKHFLVGTLALAVAIAFTGCGGKSTGHDDGGEGGDSGTSRGNAGKLQGGGTAKGGEEDATGETGGASSGGATGEAAGGGSCTSARGATGGSSGTTLGGGAGGEPSHDVGPPQHGSCTVPCELALARTGDLPGESAVLVYDFESGTATLTSDAATSRQGEWVLGFTDETDGEYSFGYGARTRNSWLSLLTMQLDCAQDSYTFAHDVERMSELVNLKTHQIVLVTYSYGDRTVRVLDAHVPKCGEAQGGACTSTGDCPAVEGGILRADAEACDRDCNASASCETTCVSQDGGVSTACASCFVDLVDCVTTECGANWCPGETANGCMNCELAHCSGAFMRCTGLDYMPVGTFTWPLDVPRLD